MKYIRYSELRVESLLSEEKADWDLEKMINDTEKYKDVPIYDSKTELPNV